ncbi:hypothetical protein LINGRAHAP2_LOCUS22890 [Linum grandiflorum]
MAKLFVLLIISGSLMICMHKVSLKGFEVSDSEKLVV